MSKVSGTFYVQLQAERNYWDNHVTGFKAVRITQKKPSSIVDDAIVVKFKSSVDADAFEQVPVVEADIPMSAIQPVAVTAIAEA